MFWRTADAPPPRPATPHRSARAVTSARRLPPLPDKQTTKTISAASPPLANKSISNTPTALLDVLHTLLAGIRRDSLRFSAGVLSGTIHLTGGRKGVDRNVTRQSNTYLPPPPGVQAEDREFFDEQQALAADREGFFAAVRLGVDGIRLVYISNSNVTPWSQRPHWLENDTAQLMINKRTALTGPLLQRSSSAAGCLDSLCHLGRFTTEPHLTAISR